MSNPAETARGVMLPVQVYPLFEQALRSAAGRPLGEHLLLVSELWSRFSDVAANNPSAWITRAFTPDEIRIPSAGNRMIGFPYTKRMNANNAVEQGAALIVCSAERAAASGVPRDRWVFPHSGAEANDTASVSERGDLCSSPAIRAAGKAALALAGVAVDDVAHVDLYSCFPSAVQVAAAELGLSLDRPLTVTGGLSFAGGPWNNYVTHALAAMTRGLRDDAGSVGLCTANGGFLTRHAVGIYSTRPPAAGFRFADCQAEADRAPHRSVVEDHVGPAEVEAWTVMHDRDGAPENGIATVLLDDGRRAWATSDDLDVLAVMLTEDLAGRPATVTDDGRLRL
jgi:acetyl-CoA C-acetyltransferase